MRAASGRPRQAYTLLEMILVMAIILIIASISIPVMQTMLADSRRSASADLLRGRLAEARSKAMEEGRPWKLAFIAGTGSYQYAPEDSTEWNNTATDAVEKIDVVRDELPKDIVFAVNRDDIVSSQGGSSPGSGWETIAVYQSDGSARDDTTSYFGKAGQAPMRAKLRALTGAVTIETPKADQ
jgi:prepilin-type N-terminal cleavage/methylation domain-containing protein